LTTEFNWDRGALSNSYSLSVLVAGPVAILAGRFGDKYGPRPLVTIGGLLSGIGFLLSSQISSLWHLYLIWGIGIGIGSTLLLLPVMAMVPRWFTKSRGIATGLVMSGMGIGGVISPLLAQWLISAYGWQSTFIILGVITLVVIIPLAQFMRHSPQRAGLKPYGGDEINEIIEDKQSQSSAMEGLSLSQAIRTSRFWLWGLIQAGLFFCIGTVGVHIVPHATDIGIPDVIAASILSISAGVGIFGRLVIGFISDKIGSLLALSICLSLGTLGIIWLLFANESWMFYLYAVVQGLSFASIVTLLPVLTAELFGVKSLGVIMGTLIFVGIIGEAIGPTLTGSIFDITGSYRLAFLICVGVIAATVILSLVLLRYKGKTGMARE